MFGVAVLISGKGSNLGSIVDAVDRGILKCEITSVISDNPHSGGLEFAKTRGIDTFLFPRKTISDRILDVVKENTDLIVCAGFLSILRGQLLEEFQNRIINIHPALIPSFCGRGMYGIKVHQAVIDYGAKDSGCTVHFVEAGVDTGPILLQKTVEVLDTDTAECLQRRILVEEHEAIVEAIRLISEERIKINGRKVFVKGRD